MKKVNFNINRESHFSLLPLSSILVELEFRGADICRGTKTIEPGEKPLERGENNQQTQPTYDLGWTEPGKVQCSRHCTNFAPQEQCHTYLNFLYYKGSISMIFYSRNRCWYNKSIILPFWLVLTYGLLGGRYIDEVINISFLYKTCGLHKLLLLLTFSFVFYKSGLCASSFPGNIMLWWISCLPCSGMRLVLFYKFSCNTRPSLCSD